jgi:5-methylcytosine-specific restriction endonuclease McrA
MTLRRYAPMKASRGTVIPPLVRAEVYARDQGCVGAKLGWPAHEYGLGLELDHVRASHAVGMKSASTSANLIVLCGSCHRWKTEHGREARPLLLAYLAEVSR